MAQRVASLYADVDVKTQDAQKNLGGFRDLLQRTTKSIKEGTGTLTDLHSAYKLTTNALSGVVNAGKAVLAWQGENIRLAGIQEDAERQLSQTISSTGGAAGYTATELKQMASELQGVTRFGDEATIKGQALLLTFTNIGRDVFPQATETMLDMSQALGQDLKSSAIQLGKALNDPITGVTALQRVGVSFTEGQKEQIRVLVENGQAMEAQKLILAELSREFGGQAAAAAETYAGKIEQLGNSWGDLKEQLGAAIRLTGEQVDGTKNLVGTTTDYLGAANRLRDEQQKGNLTWLERQAAMAEVIFTTRTGTDVLAEYTEQEIAAERAAQAFLETSYRQANQAEMSAFIAEQEALQLANLTEHLRATTESAGELSGAQSMLNSEMSSGAQSVEYLGGRAGDVAARMAELAAATAEPTGAINNLGGAVDRTNLHMEKLLGYMASLDGRSASASVDISVSGLDDVERANNLLGGGGTTKVGGGAKGGSGGVDVAGNTNTPSTGTPNTPKPGGPIGSGGGRTETGFATGTGGWLTVPPGFPNDSYIIGLSSDEKFNVVPKGQSGGINISGPLIGAVYQQPGESTQAFAARTADMLAIALRSRGF